jgi:hypothetical protein
MVVAGRAVVVGALRRHLRHPSHLLLPNEHAPLRCNPDPQAPIADRLEPNDTLGTLSRLRALGPRPKPHMMSLRRFSRPPANGYLRVIGRG